MKKEKKEKGFRSHRACGRINCKTLTGPPRPLVTVTINVFLNIAKSPGTKVHVHLAGGGRKGRRNILLCTPHYFMAIANKVPGKREKKSVTPSRSEAGRVCGLRRSELIRISPLRPTAPTMQVCGLGPEFLRVSREWAGNAEGLDCPLPKSPIGSLQFCGRHAAYGLSTGLRWLTVFKVPRWVTVVDRNGNAPKVSSRGGGASQKIHMSE